MTAEPATQPNGDSQPVAGTNNEAERTLRDPAEARKTGRTNKTLVGARRQTIIVSVLESLRLYLPTFTLASVIAEIQRWSTTGRSCFEELLEKLGPGPVQADPSWIRSFPRQAGNGIVQAPGPMAPGLASTFNRHDVGSPPAQNGRLLPTSVDHLRQGVLVDGADLPGHLGDLLAPSPGRRRR